MTTTYEIRLSSDSGTLLATIDRFTGLQYALLANDVSACVVKLTGDIDKTMFAVDRRLEIWRQAEGGPLLQEGVWFIRKIKDSTDNNGVRLIEVTGYSPNYLLSSRIVAYNAGSAQAEIVTTALDNMMKTVVLQNLSTGATDTARTISTTYLGIQQSVAAAPVASKAFARRNVLTVLQDLADASRGAGTELYFDMVPIDTVKFEFRTYVNLPGIDHTFPNGNPPVFVGLEFGNLSEPSVELDYSGEYTFVYGAGQGEEDDRVLGNAEDTARSGRSIFARREGFADAREQTTSTGVSSKAYELLAERRPRLRFSGRILSVPGSLYGVHWRHGDRVSAVYYGQQYDALVRSVEVSVTEDGEENISTRLETDDAN
ncbi:MAG: hypothetical protein Q7N50_08330 [Armatimonadota bacterium]|nr:hypothetical protein [Armatimonadota bacterium]